MVRLGSEHVRGIRRLAIAVLSGVASRDDLAPHADYVLADIGELPALFAIASGHTL